MSILIYFVRKLSRYVLNSVKKFKIVARFLFARGYNTVTRFKKVFERKRKNEVEESQDKSIS